MAAFDKYVDEAALIALPSSDDEADIDDEDTCSAPELTAQFQLHFKPQDESVVSLKHDYVLKICADSTFVRIAAGLSSTAVQLYDLSTAGDLSAVYLDRVPKILPTGKRKVITICGVGFLDSGPDTLLVGTTDGVVRLFDLRTTGEQARFEYNHVKNAFPVIPKSMTCFDCNANGRILCTGTEEYSNNACLLFYDVRERKHLGAYFESHSDDVTSIRFHPRKPDLLCSGATDGLINVYNIQENFEDEALLNTFNTESSVQRLNWHRNVFEQDVISCITHTNDFKSYECQEGDELAAFERSAITESIRRKNAANFNLINAHNLEDNGVFLLAGTNFNKGEIMRSVSISNKETLTPLANFVGNKQIVRDSLYDSKRNLLVTGGESGIVTVWTTNTSSTSASSSKDLKSKTKSKSHKTTPY
ncbi:WD repeat-containing protein 89 [Scaptodrosophila lebanonensis]|uniref:WD repeat-containing protein 89 n=1 Tax=Drosophila lebanonensis TaxID=7225 RepID=A0A6J2UHJ5_DROLE|nr:WD repeat-containing protein 89 [Scaptodrosophila lebanonensis]